MRATAPWGGNHSSDAAFAVDMIRGMEVLLLCYFILLLSHIIVGQ